MVKLHNSRLDNSGYSLSGFLCYQYYLSIKLHFNDEEFDYTKYGYKTAKRIAYDKRTDKYFFDKLSKQYNKRTIIPFLIANFRKNPDRWIGTLCINNIDTHECYLEYVKDIGRMYITFEEELEDLKEYAQVNRIEFKDLFVIKNGKPPIIYKMFMQNLLSIETYIVLDGILNLFSVMDKKLKNDFTWNNIYRLRLIKYKSFVVYDKLKYINKMKEVLVD